MHLLIRSKSLNYNYLTISDSTSSLLKVLMIGVFPLLYLGVGIAVVLRRRRLQNETVYFTQRDGQHLPLDPDRVEDYLSTVETLYLTDYVTYNASEEDLSTYGLNDPDLTISVNYTGTDEEGEAFSDLFTLSIARDPAEQEAAQQEDAESDDTDGVEEITAYARVCSDRTTRHTCHKKTPGFSAGLNAVEGPPKGGPEAVEKVAVPLFRAGLHARQASIPSRKVGLPCVKSVISDAHVAENDGLRFYSAACGRRNSLQEGFFYKLRAALRRPSCQYYF